MNDVGTNITLNDLDLPLNKGLNRKVVKLNRRSPNKRRLTPEHQKVITVINPPTEEERPFDTNQTNAADSHDQVQIKIEQNLQEETESEKDYDLSLEESSDNLGSDIEKNTG